MKLVDSSIIVPLIGARMSNVRWLRISPKALVVGVAVIRSANTTLTPKIRSCAGRDGFSLAKRASIVERNDPPAKAKRPAVRANKNNPIRLRCMNLIRPYLSGT